MFRTLWHESCQVKLPRLATMVWPLCSLAPQVLDLTTEAKDTEAIAKLNSDLAYLFDERNVEGFCRQASLHVPSGKGAERESSSRLS